MSKLSAKHYWQTKFGEPPTTDADKLAVAMMTEYHAAALAAIRKELSEKRDRLYKELGMDDDYARGRMDELDLIRSLLDHHNPTA